MKKIKFYSAYNQIVSTVILWAFNIDFMKMNKIMRFFLIILISIFFFGTSNAEEFRIDFSNEGMKLLKKRGFGKKTEYTNGKDENGWFIKAVADGSATGLGLELNKNLLKEMPFLNVTFKIEKDFNNIDQTMLQN